MVVVTAAVVGRFGGLVLFSGLSFVVFCCFFLCVCYFLLIAVLGILYLKKIIQCSCTIKIIIINVSRLR